MVTEENRGKRDRGKGETEKGGTSFGDIAECRARGSQSTYWNALPSRSRAAIALVRSLFRSICIVVEHRWCSRDFPGHEKPAASICTRLAIYSHYYTYTHSQVRLVTDIGKITGMQRRTEPGIWAGRFTSCGQSFRELSLFRTLSPRFVGCLSSILPLILLKLTLKLIAVRSG